MTESAILFDATKCAACRGCQVACKQWNELSGEVTTNRGTYENPPDLSANTWIKIRFREEFKDGRIRWLFSRQSCMHCTEAACVDVCPSGALYHNEYGFVGFDKEKCIGCGYCSQYCPFSVPRLDAGLISGVGKMSKCSLCTTPGLNRISENGLPACVKTCPNDALVFGSREEMIAEGKRRVATLVSLDSGAFSEARLYGEKELGGLHVLYVLADSPELYGLPVEPEYPVLAALQENIGRPYAWLLWGAVAAGLAVNVMVARARQIRKKGEE